jgi:hypothetical protein
MQFVSVAPLLKTLQGEPLQGSTMNHYPVSSLGFGCCPEDNNDVATRAGCDPFF